MVFGGEDVPLRENILKKDIEFVKSWVEWSADNREQVIISRTVNPLGGVVFLTVPEKKTFFMTGLCMIGVSDTTGDGQGIRSSSHEFLMEAETKVSAASPISRFSNSITFSMPLKFESGEKIDLLGGTGGNIAGTIFGFFVPKKIT